MKKLLIAAFLFLLPGLARASENFMSDTQTVIVSTTPSAPTTLMTYKPGAFIQHSVVCNATTFNLFIAATSVGITTGTAAGSSPTAFIPPSTTCFSLDQEFPQDMNGGVWQGALFGVLASTVPTGGVIPTPQEISVIRTR